MHYHYFTLIFFTLTLISNLKLVLTTFSQLPIHDKTRSRKCSVQEDTHMQPHLTSLSAGWQRPLQEWIVMSLRGDQGFRRLHRLHDTYRVSERQTERERDQLYVRSEGPGASGPIHRGPAKCWQHPPWHPIRFQQGLQDSKSQSTVDSWIQCQRRQFLSSIINILEGIT